MSYQQIAAGLMFLALVACSDKGGAAARTDGSATADSIASPPPVGMELKAMPMLPGFRAHLDTLAHTPGMMRGLMSQHQANVRDLVAAMHSDMMALGVRSDAEYEALADSVVEGSRKLGSAAGADFNRRVARHIDQLRRLTAMYEAKTAGTR
jgi:hypothetical protein